MVKGKKNNVIYLIVCRPFGWKLTWVVYGHSSVSICGGAVWWCLKWSRAHARPDMTSLEVTGGDRKWRHQKSWTGNRKWKGGNFRRFLPVFPAIFPGTPLDSRYEQWNCRKLRNIKLKRHVTPKGSLGRGGMRPCVTGSRRFLPIRESFDEKWRMSCPHILLIFHSLIIRFVFVFVIFFRELSIYKDVSWFLPLIFVFIQHLNHYCVDRVLITNNYTLNILPYHKNQSWT
jgi:hypothetical protein